MGYGLPAAVGVCVSRRGGRTICIEGDGSLQMNIQELQTVFQNRLDIKIFVLNNRGYHSIRQAQGNMFPDRCMVGVGEESGDLSFPELERIAYAYRLPYIRISDAQSVEDGVRKALMVSGPVIVEAVVDPGQPFAPKLSARRLADGTMVSPSLEDMSPFLPQEEIAALRREAESL